MITKLLAVLACVFLLSSPVVVFAQEEGAAEAVETASSGVIVAPEAETVVAPPDNTATIPAGEYIDGFTDIVVGVLTMFGAGFITYALRFVPMGFRGVAGFVLNKVVDKAIQNIKEYGLNATLGVDKDMKLDVPLGNAVLANATEYGMAELHAWLLKYIGGRVGLQRKVFRSLNMDATVNEENMGIPPVTPDGSAHTPAKSAQRKSTGPGMPLDYRERRK